MHATEAARAGALCIGVVLALSGCATAASDREERLSGGRISPIGGGGASTGRTGGSFVYADVAIERGCGLGLLDDRFRVVLITDGEPTCSDDTARVATLAGEWNQVGVETWVMGLPGSASELVFGEALVMVSGEKPKFPNRRSPTSVGGANTQNMMVYVDDAAAR